MPRGSNIRHSNAGTRKVMYKQAEHNMGGSAVGGVQQQARNAKILQDRNTELMHQGMRKVMAKYGSVK